MRALTAAEEAFLTSSTREVQAIATVDGTAIPVAPGPVTLQIRAAFRARIAEEVAATVSR